MATTAKKPVAKKAANPILDDEADVNAETEVDTESGDEQVDEETEAEETDESDEDETESDDESDSEEAADAPVAPARIKPVVEAPVPPARIKPVTAAPVAPAAKENIGQIMNRDARIMKEALAKQPKVRFIIPLGIGEKRGMIESVWQNGYRTDIPKGEWVDVPQSVADILMKHYGMVDSVANNFQIDRLNSKEGINPHDALS